MGENEKYINDLFLSWYGDLNDYSKTADYFKLLKTGGVLRILLLDPKPLMHLANKKFKLKIRFKVNDLPKINDFPGKPMIICNSYMLDPTIMTLKNPVLVKTLDQFLAQNIIESEECFLTILELIKFVANKFGGIHFDETLSYEQKKKKLLLDKLSNIGLNPVPFSMKVSSRIVLTALKPLYEAILKLSKDR